MKEVALRVKHRHNRKEHMDCNAKLRQTNSSRVAKIITKQNNSKRIYIVVDVQLAVSNDKATDTVKQYREQSHGRGNTPIHLIT